MRFFYMVLVNCKKNFKDYKNLIFMFIIPIACVFFVNNVLGDDNKENLTVNVGIINLDKGSLGKEVLSDFKGVKLYNNKEVALKELKKYSVIAIYEIPESFTTSIQKGTKPDINVYKIEEGNTTNLFEFQLEEKINKLAKIKMLESENLINNEKEINKNFINLKYTTEKGKMNAKDFMPIVLLMFFMLSFSSGISSDLLNLRKEKILERFLSTNNNGYAIIGSIYLSMIITQTTMYMASFMVMKFAFGINFSNFGFLLLNIILMSIISVSLAVMVNRIFKDSNIATAIITISSLIMFSIYFTGTLEATSNKYPKILGVLSKFTPLYWCLDSIEKSILFPNIFVLVLIALVFFTAGSIRYSNFAKES
ncbi:ABC-2 type transport system permease protein [Clostridium cavendishii DSM 21758]|uniref:ABC-2 type transport system permease protein n=1 Tax=Clostridium cavendishii DSM 21758 TaxID=1121302 RepID=A0A1M6UVL1_9CLOT|nr:ABC transporter permease [Clostridium cavendishii]SHK73290.1 ABC-2 type transport system permease protein [Clostridium cavendishii DSM 21758]